MDRAWSWKLSAANQFIASKCMNDSWFTIFMIMMRECYYMYKQLCVKKGANNLAICVLDFQINWRATCSQKLITGCRYLTSYSQKNASNTVIINGDILHIWILLNTVLWNHYMYRTSTMYQYVQITKWKFCPKHKFLSHQKEVRSLCYTLGIASVST